jgi:hypothetical protein
MSSNMSRRTFFPLVCHTPILILLFSAIGLEMPSQAQSGMQIAVNTDLYTACFEQSKRGPLFNSNSAEIGRNPNDGAFGYC